MICLESSLKTLLLTCRTPTRLDKVFGALDGFYPRKRSRSREDREEDTFDR